MRLDQMSTDDRLKFSLERRLKLANSNPVCSVCREDKQIQLQDWLRVPAQWKCRRCGAKWEGKE